MKTTCEWLNDYCRHGLAPEELADRLTMAGLAVEALEAVDDDYLLDLEIASNRPDLLGMIGIARELSALTQKPLRAPEIALVESDAKAERLAAVTVEDPDLCPRYTARVITGVKIAPSPEWLAARLERVGFRPVNNVVDITNYVLLECGQPLHAFDLNRLQGNEIIVRRGRQGETMMSIDGHERELTPDMLIIADAMRAVAVAGIMGGLDSEVGGNTSDVLLESARFDGPTIRRTSRALGMATDASYRFERGVDPVGVEWASQRAASMIREICGGEIAEGVIDVWAAPFEPYQVSLRLGRLAEVLGVRVPRERTEEILRALEFTVERADDKQIVITVPPFRPDIGREVDLIEEIARVYGYDRIPETTSTRVAIALPSMAERVNDELLRTLSGLGFHETVSTSLANAERARMISPWAEGAAIAFNNTVRHEEGFLRVSIMPDLVRLKSINQAHGNARAELFELAKVYLPQGGRKQPKEQMCLAILEEDGLADLKGVIEVVLENLGLAGRCAFETWQHELFQEGQAARIVLDGDCLGVGGQLASSLVGKLDFRTRPALAELNVDLLVEKARLDVTFETLPGFPGVLRDLAVVVADNVAWAEIEACVREAGGPHLVEVGFFDLYRGKQVPEGGKSLAFSLTFRAPDRTLTNDEVDGHVADIVKALESRLSATLRA